MWALPVTASSLGTLAAACGVCAATSFAFPRGNPLEPRSPGVRATEFGAVLPVLAGALLLASLRSGALLEAASLVTQAAGVTLALAAAGWLLLTRAPSETEERVFAVAVLLLVGGLAEALSLSALLGGLVAGRVLALRRRPAARHVSAATSLLVQHAVRGARAGGGRRARRAHVESLGAGVGLPAAAPAPASGWRCARRARDGAAPRRPGWCCRLLRAGRLRRRVRAERAARSPGPTASLLLSTSWRWHRSPPRSPASFRPPGGGRVRRLLALALAIAAMLWVRELGVAGHGGSAGTALALGFTLIGAWVTGDVLRRFQLPRLTGYLLFGVLVGPVPRQRHHRVDGRAAPGRHRHRHDAHRAHRRPDAQLRAARPARSRRSRG